MGPGQDVVSYQHVYATRDLMEGGKHAIALIVYQVPVRTIIGACVYYHSGCAATSNATPQRSVVGFCQFAGGWVLSSLRSKAS
mmetsp:Transcript_113811/g.179093  ORF Transcript_113811/g.179093 Transcript_113811/m.179093 type:complete len:83 (+) Transcript_113811:589-837(+)